MYIAFFKLRILSLVKKVSSLIKRYNIVTVSVARETYGKIRVVFAFPIFVL